MLGASIAKFNFRAHGGEQIARGVNVTNLRDIFQDDWRGLKDLFKQIRYRRGRLGAGFTLTFINQKVRLVFSLGLLGQEELGSATDQIAHLTGIVAQMMRPETMIEPLGQVEASFDMRTDRWQGFRGIGLAYKKEYVFDENLFRWKTR